MPIRRIDPHCLLANEDWVENIAAFTCPACGCVFIVSEDLHREGRNCPGCFKARGHVKGRRDHRGTAEVRWGDTLVPDPASELTAEERAAAERDQLLIEVCRLWNGPDARPLTELIPESVPLTNLETAAFYGESEQLKQVLDAGADPNEPSALFGTALHAAADQGRLEAVRLLLERDADPARLNAQGQSPADVAAENGHEEVAELLRSAASPP